MRSHSLRFMQLFQLWLRSLRHAH